ncbi:uncharacterized protein DEA37_0008675 [Paragonimus westermani]|uniref:Uncharacterized protein n=1 Tax=Paragonimus westermani TaxID=34504 RepID=A0A5J4P338_9TREM|nr:uncharacterized protein DEA37_0008675 [Paragonimus westermani]
MLVEEVDSLSYNDLRKAAKLFNIKTNKKDLELGCHPVNHVNGSSVHFPNLPTSVVFTDRLAKPSKPDVPKVVGNTLKSLSVRTVPDFGRIHARAAAKMESLPDYLRRRQQVIAANTKRPPFASPQFQTGGKRTDGKSTLSTLTSVPLADLSNHEVGPPLKRSDPIVFSGHTSICSPMKHGSNRSLNSLSSRLSSKRHTPTIPEDSAFSRRKAYDLKRRLSHTGLLPKRISATNDPPNPSVGPPSSDTMVTVRRRDPVVRSLSAHVAMHKQRAHALSQTLRQGAKQAIISGRRGLLPV